MFFFLFNLIFLYFYEIRIVLKGDEIEYNLGSLEFIYYCKYSMLILLKLMRTIQGYHKARYYVLFSINALFKNIITYERRLKSS